MYSSSKWVPKWRQSTTSTTWHDEVLFSLFAKRDMHEQELHVPP